MLKQNTIFVAEKEENGRKTFTLSVEELSFPTLQRCIVEGAAKDGVIIFFEKVENV